MVADATEIAAAAKAAEVVKAEATKAIEVAKARVESVAAVRKCNCYEDMRGLVVCEGCKSSLNLSVFEYYNGHVYDGSTKLKLTLPVL